MDASRAARFPFVPTAEPPMVITGADDVWLHTADGRRILDSGGGAVVTNIGHGRSELADIAARAMRTVDYVIPPWATESRVALIEDCLLYTSPSPRDPE